MDGRKGTDERRDREVGGFLAGSPPCFRFGAAEITAGLVDTSARYGIYGHVRWLREEREIPNLDNWMGDITLCALVYRRYLPISPEGEERGGDGGETDGERPPVRIPCDSILHT